MSIIFRKTNPRRPVDWRWQLAEYLLNSGGRIRRSRLDSYIKQAISFRRQLNRCQNDDDYMRLLHAAPDLYEAWALFDDGEDKETRWELEARLLTPQTYQEIAKIVALEPEAVQAYEALFFNVRDRVESPSYITHIVLGKSIHAGLNERAYDALWKMYGYWAGPHVLNSLIYRFNVPAAPDAPDGVNAFWDDDTKDMLRMKSAIAMRTMPINWDTQIEILNLYMRMLEIERNAGEGGSGSETVLANINTLFTQIPWTKQRYNLEVADQTDPIAVVDMTGNTLRASELAIIAADKKIPPALEQMLNSMKFPESTDAQNDKETQ